MISGLSRLRRLQMLVPRTQIALEVSTPWYMQTAGDIPNDQDIVLILVIRQLTKQYTHFACCQVPHFLWWGDKVVSIHRNVAVFVLRLVSKWPH